MSWLLPSNRKLRHLEGLSLRNLMLVRPAGRPRRQTIDDESIPTELKSPAKILAQTETRLEHSKSATDLKAVAADGASDSANGALSSPTKKPRQNTRRRSTLTWANESPETRRKLLQDAITERRPDTFFSLHRSDASLNEPPEYISEVREKFMNPDFQHFNLASSTEFSRQSSLTVRIWSRIDAAQPFALLIEADIDLGSLIRVGKTLDTFYHPFSDNAIILHMTDGVYTSISDLPNVESVLNPAHMQPPTPRTATFAPRETSSFDALMKLKDLAECIEDAERTRVQVTQQIEVIIDENQAKTDVVSDLAQTKASVDAVEDACGRTRRQVQKLREEISSRRQTLDSRRAAIESQSNAQQAAEPRLASSLDSLNEKRSQQGELRSAISGHTRRIAQDLLDIYPIEPIDGHPLCFTIRGHFLPNAKVFESESHAGLPPLDHETTAAALGYVAHVVSMLETTLLAPLPYTPNPYGSTSTIFDALSSAREIGLSGNAGFSVSLLGRPRSDNSAMELEHGSAIPTPQSHPSRLFPLYQQNTPPKRFRWAIYLLNKDVEELMQPADCKIIDPRTTLANLKFLLNVLASGKGDAPGRKAGVVKGLVGKGAEGGRSE